MKLVPPEPDHQPANTRYSRQKRTRATTRGFFAPTQPTKSSLGHSHATLRVGRHSHRQHALDRVEKPVEIVKRVTTAEPQVRYAGVCHDRLGVIGREAFERLAQRRVV